MLPFYSKRGEKVSVSRKLPIMYLIDSIIKNLSTTEYPQLFSQCIVQIFCGVFEEVDEKTRTSLYKLRQTWVDIIPNKQLYILDRKVQLIDPAWPITAKAPETGVIHVNPKFLKQNKEIERSPQFSPLQTESSAEDTYEELIAKERELEALRLKVELAEAKAKLETQRKQIEEQAILKRNNKVIDREPPAGIKLPPVLGSSTQNSNRDPRLNRGPPVNRDPRLKRQMEREEQERLIIEKPLTKPEMALAGKTADKTSDSSLSIRSTSSSLTESSSTSPRMDLASLISSFTVAAAKVAAESKKSPQACVAPKQVEVTQQKKMVESKPKADLPKERTKVDDTIATTSRNKKNVSPVEKQRSASSSSSISESQSKSKSKVDLKEASNELKKISSSRSREKIDGNSSEKTQKELKGKLDNKDDKEKRDKDKEKISSERRDSKERRASKERRESRERRDSKERKDSKERDRRDKDKRDSKESDRIRDKKDRRLDLEPNRHSPRRNFGRRSPDFRRGARNERPSRVRQRDKRGFVPVIHTANGETDQFGRMLRNSQSGSSSRDRSPLDPSRDTLSSSPKTLESEDKALIKNIASEEAPVDESEKSNAEVFSSDKNDHAALLEKVTGDVEEKRETSPIVMDADVSEQNMDIEEESVEDQKELDLNQDVDMRIQPITLEKRKDKFEDKVKEKPDSSNDTNVTDSSGSLKRLNSESEIKIEVRPYKIPKLDPTKKTGSKNEDNQEDISKLFGEEDVDYRHQLPPKNLLAPPPFPVDSLLSPTANLKSPAQRRWSQFKESHPDDFAQDIERKRLRDAQMQSIAMENQDVDLRQMQPNQRPLPVAMIDSTMTIPKDLSIENQEQILQKAEQELKEGRITHGEHQEIVRQLGQVYDIQKKRHSLEDRQPRSLDMRDPRLRGIRERGGYSDEADRRGSYKDVSLHKKTLLPSLPLSGDMPDESAGNSPRYRDRRDYNLGYEAGLNEDYDGRRPPRPSARHDRRGVDINRRRGPPLDYDGRSPRDFDMDNSRSPHEYDDHTTTRFRDFDGMARRDETYNKRGLDYDDRRPSVDDDERHRDYRDSRPYDDYDKSKIRKPPMPLRGQRQDDLRERRRNTPPQEGSYRGLSDELQLPRPYGMPDERQVPRPYDKPTGPRPFGPRHPAQDIRGPHPNFMPMRPQGPRSDGPKLNPMPVSSIINESPRISDPMDDPRWSAMRGLLDNEGAEEIVIDGKPFELRMGTSRKLRIYGKVMDVAVDLKERGIRIDNQLVYKLGEPIKEVPAAGRSVRLYYHGLPKPIWLDGQQHEMRMDAPPRNVMVDGFRRGFQIDGRDMMILVDRLEKGPYGGPPRKIRIAGVDHDIAFQAPPRRILIDNKSCELKLDSKIPYVIINGKPHGIRFDGEPRTVFINEQPFTIPVDRAEKIRIGPRPTYIAFGGPAHEIIIDGKWFEVKFDNVPKDIHLGNRHFSIRIPGPLPRVKILDEIPPNVDESRLMSSHELQMSQNVQPRMPQSEPAQMEPFMSNPNTLITPVGPSEGTIEAVAPNTQTGEGIMRPVGPVVQDIQFNQPGATNIVAQSQPIMAQPGQPSMLPQQNQIMQGQMQNPLLGIRQNLMGFGLNQTNIPRQPVNMLAQGLFTQVASGMMNNQFGGIAGLPDFAAGLRALGQMTSQAPSQQLQMTPQIQQTLPNQIQPQIPAQLPPFQQQMPPPLQNQIPPLQTQLPTQLQSQIPQLLQSQIPTQLMHKEEDHGAALVTGIQGNAFGINQFGKPVLSNVQITNTPGLPVLPNPLAVSNTMLDTTVKPPIDINSLLNNLLKVGLIKDTPKVEIPSTTVSEASKMPKTPTAATATSELEKKKATIPNLTDFNVEKLRKQYSSVIELLHEGIQCHTCAARFTMNDVKYRAHLDWHFRQNKMEQEMVKVAKNRKWFYSIPDWVQYEELEDTEEKSRSEIFEQMRPNEEKPSVVGHTISFQALEGKDVIKNPVATGIEGEDVCATCGDPFDQMWNEETEEWILKNTIKVDGKTYHPVCYEDAQETPTPIIAPSKNPLDQQLADVKNVDHDVTDNSEPDALVSVKLEPEEIKLEPVESKEINMDVDQEIKTEPAEDSVGHETCVTEEMSEAQPLSELPDSESVLTENLTQAPNMLSTLSTTIVREVIPISHDDPMSPWEMDSNPTPELSRTPTPEPTPALSVSSESIISLAPNSEEVMSSEDPIPPAQLAVLKPATTSSQQKKEPTVTRVDNTGL
ncbi:zinc finger CCCH domain-containing protein 13-like isoform X2 [Biomphalaria pfeifferi]|uniref:Zinc finger CCCH domain-containing protein 13-like isoform X2 n=1 Tax=Biomphalaria pfeifferi TaxID=112525 RepID=A0AAD8C266_BIOPF|nr:zinc finger CCCH domain-containing protein 13-like isoform X2 [Biomphalaria pfeifferi]